MKTLLLFLAIMAWIPAISQQNLPSEIDFRARRYYSDAQISQMTPLQIAQVNFIYAHSFVINTDKPCPECPTLNLSDIDVAKLERKQSQRARVYQTVPGHPVDLLSYDELDLELQRIANEFNVSNNQH